MNYKSCLVCRSKFFKKVTRSRKSWNEAKFCSYKCYRKYWINTTLKKIKEKNNKIEHICKICNNIFLDYSSNKRVFCSKGCRSKWVQLNLSGINHYNWKGGITPKINIRCNSDWWKKLRLQVYIRDNFTCQICGIKCEKNDPLKKIQCDHIIKERLGGLHTMNNLQTLCLKCHIKKDWNNLKFKENYM